MHDTSHKCRISNHAAWTAVAPFMMGSLGLLAYMPE